nr:hypothetical protein [Tanacetum cinerariifolium]
MKEKGDACIFMGYSTHTSPLNNHTTPAPTSQVPTLASTVTSNVNMTQAKTYAKNDQVADDEFINIFSTPVQDRGETSSRHVDLSNMHTFYHRYPSEHRWTKDHPLEQVIRNPSQSVRTRRQLESEGEMCMFALTVSQTEPKNIKEAMADSAWIESMQEELHQFDRLDVWELVDRPLFTNVINLKWLKKTKHDEENTALYGLKQAPRAWYDELSKFLLSKEFSKGEEDEKELVEMGEVGEVPFGKGEGDERGSTAVARVDRDRDAEKEETGRI